MTYFPAYPIKPFEAKEMELVVRSGQLDAYDLTPLFAEGRVVLDGMPILLSDFKVTISKQQGIASILATPYLAFEDLIRQTPQGLWLFVQYQNELIIYKNIRMEHLKGIEIGGEIYAHIVIPIADSHFGYVGTNNRR